ncbi:MAG: fibrinogen-like YCDxxxxGGGW domain-containing protein [Myxococcota bacterium]
MTAWKHVALSVAWVVGALWGAVAVAAVPATVLVEGALVSTGGGPVADGDYDVTFALYDVDKNGQALWSEGPTKIAVQGGQFTYLLGSVTPIDATVLGKLDKGWLEVAIAPDPALPRKSLASVLFARKAGIAESLSCSGCIGAAQLDAQVLAPYAKAADLSKVATSGAYADLSGTPDLSGYAQSANLAKVATSGAFADLAGGPDLTAYAKTASLADVATTGSYTDLSGTPVLAKLGAACGSGLVIKGLKEDGSYDCVKAFDVSLLPPDGLNEISNGLLTNQFIDDVKSTKVPVDIPDNNPVGVANVIAVPDLGVAQGLDVTVELTNSDISKIAVEVFDPAGTKYVLHSKSGSGTSLKTTYPSTTKTVSGDLTSWIGKNPKGNWSLNVIDTAFLNNGVDGKLLNWSVKIQTLSSQKVSSVGLLVTDGGLQVKRADSAPVTCNTATFGYIYASPKDNALYVCNGAKFFPLWLTVPPGGSQEDPGLSCKQILTVGPASKSGLYWLDPDGVGGVDPFQTWCEMSAAGGGWTLVFNLDTNDATGRWYTDTDFWTSASKLFGTAAGALTGDFKSQAFNSLVANEIMVFAHSEGSPFSNPQPFAAYSLATAAKNKTMAQIMAFAANTTITAGSPLRQGVVSAPGAYTRNAGDVFIDNGLPIIVNSTGAGGSDAQNTVRIGTDFGPICAIVDCNGHSVQGGYGGYHARPSSGGYPLTYEAMPNFGYHPGPMGFGDNWINNNGCGNSVWTNTCGPTSARPQVDFGIFVR